MSVKRRSPLLVLLPQVEPEEVAVQLEEDYLGLGNLGVTLQSELATGHPLLWCGLFPGIFLR